MTATAVTIVTSLSNYPGRGSLGIGALAEKLETTVNETIVKLEKQGRAVVNVSTSIAANDQGKADSMSATILHSGPSE